MKNDVVQSRGYSLAHRTAETQRTREIFLVIDGTKYLLCAGDGLTVGGLTVYALPAIAELPTGTIDTAADYIAFLDVTDNTVKRCLAPSGGGGGGGTSDPTITDLGNVNSATALTIDASKGYKCTATGNLSFSFSLSGLTSTVEYRVSLRITQDGTGGRTLVFTGTNIDAPAALLSVPIAAGAGKKTYVEFRVHNNRVELVNVVMDLRNM